MCAHVVLVLLVLCVLLGGGHQVVALYNTLFLPLSPSLPLHAFLHLPSFLTRHLHVPLISFDVPNYRVALEFRSALICQAGLPPCACSIYSTCLLLLEGPVSGLAHLHTLCTLLSGEALLIVDGLASVYTPFPLLTTRVHCLVSSTPPTVVISPLPATCVNLRTFHYLFFEGSREFSVVGSEEALLATSRAALIVAHHLLLSNQKLLFCHSLEIAGATS